MKASKIRFSQLRDFLRELGFSEVPDKEGWRFEHATSSTVFLFRPYRLKDRVYEHDLFRIRTQLTARDLAADDALEQFLTKSPA